jgi:hypothetical protein
MQLDPSLFPMIDAFRAAGYAVKINFDKSTYVVTATDRDGDSSDARDEDCARAVRTLAGKLGVSLEDA